MKEITVNEVYDYLKEEVRKATSNNQTPVMFGDREIVIAKDMRSVCDSLTLEIARMARDERIDTEYTGLYLKILVQKESDDNELEKKVRKYLLTYLSDNNLTSLIAQTTVAISTQSSKTENNQQQTPESVNYTTTDKGQLPTWVIAGNELAKTGRVLLNGRNIGTLSAGIIYEKQLSPGIHKISVDSEQIDKMKEVTFRSDYEELEIVITAESATRYVRITTEPAGAKIWINGEQLEKLTPTQEKLKVGSSYEIRVEIDKYGRKQGR